MYVKCISFKTNCTLYSSLRFEKHKITFIQTFRPEISKNEKEKYILLQPKTKMAAKNPEFIATPHNYDVTTTGYYWPIWRHLIG
jgi:hypothetical protein